MDLLTNKVCTDDFQMEYLQFGHGKNTLVILPGLSVQSVIPLAPMIVKRYEIFTEDFTVYILDRRLTVPPVYSIHDMAEDTVKVLKQLKLKDISLFGTSQGGMLAMTIAAEYPELVKNLVLCSTAMRVDEKRFSVIDKWIKLAQKQDRYGLYLSMGENIFPKQYFEKIRDAFCSPAGTVTDDELSRFVILAESIRNFNIEDKFSDIACPVLLANDEKDDVFGKEPTLEMENALRYNPQLQVEWYNGFGHVLYDTAPDFQSKMYRFLITHNS